MTIVLPYAPAWVVLAFGGVMVVATFAFYGVFFVVVGKDLVEFHRTKEVQRAKDALAKYVADEKLRAASEDPAEAERQRVEAEAERVEEAMWAAHWQRVDARAYAERDAKLTPDERAALAKRKAEYDQSEWHRLGARNRARLKAQSDSANS